MTRRIDNPDTPADIELRSCLSEAALTCFVMIAGAGSGKTTSLVKALDFLGKSSGPKLRQMGQQVACITYTEVAVEEIFGDVGSDSLFHVSTIHSFLWSIVKPFQADIARWVTARMEEKLAELREEQAGFGARVFQTTRDRVARSIARLERQIPEMHAVKHFTYGTGSKYEEGILGHDDIIRIGPEFILRFPLLARVIAQRYPYFFVDESQDTLPEVVAALKHVAQSNPGSFSLGFFGDPMQKIYVAGVGEIPLEQGWRRIEKTENFRCPASVLAVINNVRRNGDGLQQTGGRHEKRDGVIEPVLGTARLFVLPADDRRVTNLEMVRRWLAAADDDQRWVSGSEVSGVRILVIEHRMAAKRLGFSELHSAFCDKAPTSFRDAFRDGSSWALQPFTSFVIPVVQAFNCDQQFELISLLRTHCPRLEESRVAQEDSSSLFANIRTSVEGLVNLMDPGSSATVRQVLDYLRSRELCSLDERILDHLSSSENIGAEPRLVDGTGSLSEEESQTQLIADSISRYLACNAAQLLGYDTYQKDLSSYSTHQGVKGAEFSRVIVILDDDEGNHKQFSYDKLLGLKPLSKTDTANIAEGKDSVLERTRRLFYVCCSRATHHLAVVVFVQDVATALALLRDSSAFDSRQVYALEDIVK
jgi:DNA helicase-2/ATP-dependent DNA helicase PcrA